MVLIDILIAFIVIQMSLVAGFIITLSLEKPEDKEDEKDAEEISVTRGVEYVSKMCLQILTFSTTTSILLTVLIKVFIYW